MCKLLLHSMHLPERSRTAQSRKPTSHYQISRTQRVSYAVTKRTPVQTFSCVSVTDYSTVQAPPKPLAMPKSSIYSVFALSSPCGCRCFSTGSAVLLSPLRSSIRVEMVQDVDPDAPYPRPVAKNIILRNASVLPLPPQSV